MATRRQKVTAVLIVLSFLPLWTSGLREGMIFWEFLANHTILGPPAEYLEESYYLPDQPVPLEVTAWPK